MLSVVIDDKAIVVQPNVEASLIVVLVLSISVSWIFVFSLFGLSVFPVVEFPDVVWFGSALGVVPGVVGSTGIPGISVPPFWLSGFSVVPGFWTWLLSCSSLPVAGKFCTCSPAASAWPLFFKKTVTPVTEAAIKTKDTSPITTFFVFKNFPFILTSIKIFKWFLLLLLQVCFCLYLYK